jgi:hypothetical protein
MTLAGCSSISYETVYPTLSDQKYDSEFPYKASSEELEKIGQSMYRITSMCFYKIFTFDPADNITVKNLNNKKVFDKAIHTEFGEMSTAGSASILSSDHGKVSLLTCAHTISAQDTIISFQLNRDGTASNIIETISIKEDQNIYVAGFPEGSEVEILAMDDAKDIALIGRNYGPLSTHLFPVLDYPIGKSEELEWGTFVYLFGYPINYKMITKAIVSSPNRDNQGSFLVDAVVNPGFSGGIVLAIRDGVPNFEIVGIVQWVPEEEEIILQPQRLKTGESYNPLVAYENKIYTKKLKTIRYGVTKIIPTREIRNFLDQNYEQLAKKGYFIKY